jgi:hypothetical protein
MGCCENRDEDAKREGKKDKRKALKTLSFSQMQNQDLLVVPDRSPLSKQLDLHNNSGSLRLYIEWCKSLRKWNEIVEFIGDFTELQESFEFIQGVNPPQTISSLVVVYLYLELQKESKLVLEVVEKAIFDVFRIMNKCPEEFLEKSLILTKLFLKIANDEAIDKLIRFGMFEVLHNVLKNRVEGLGKIMLQVFFNGIHGRHEGKQAFWTYGLDDLFEIFEKKGKKSRKMTLLVIKILEEMISDLPDDLLKQSEAKVRLSKVFQELKLIHLDGFSDERRERIQIFIKKLDE